MELWSMPIEGGVPSPLVRNEEVDYHGPWISANGARLLYNVSGASGTHFEWLDPRTRTEATRLKGPTVLTAENQLVPLIASSSLVWDMAENGPLTPGLADGRRTILFANTPILKHPKLHLYLASLSPDQRWVAFTGEARGLAPHVFVAPFRGKEPVPSDEWTRAAPCDYPRWDRSGSLLCLEGLSLVRRSWDPVRRLTGVPVLLNAFTRNSPSPAILPPGWFRLAVSQDRIVFPVGTISTQTYRVREVSSGWVSRFAPESLITSSGGILMKKLLMYLGLVASVSQAAIMYDLKTDFSNANNPNGVWSFTVGSNLLTKFNFPNDPNNLHLAATNGYWGRDLSTVENGVFKMTGGSGAPVVGYNANDFVADDVLIHGANNSDLDSQLYIRWTAPQDGSITYTGGVWYAHSPVSRSQDFFVNLNGGANLNTGTVSNAQNRSNIQNFNSASTINVSTGDVLALRISKSDLQSFGSLAGVNLSVTFEPTASSGIPEPSTIALTGGAILLAALRRLRN
jgi:hypothetical protein